MARIRPTSRPSSIRSKLSIAFAALVVMFIALGATAIDRFRVMEASARDLSTNYTLAIGYLSDMRQAVTGYRNIYLRALAERDTSPGAADRFKDSLQQNLDRARTRSKLCMRRRQTPRKRSRSTQSYRTSWGGVFQDKVAPLNALVASGKFDAGAAMVADVAVLGGQAGSRPAKGRRVQRERGCKARRPDHRRQQLGLLDCRHHGAGVGRYDRRRRRHGCWCGPSRHQSVKSPPPCIASPSVT